MAVWDKGMIADESHEEVRSNSYLESEMAGINRRRASNRCFQGEYFQCVRNLSSKTLLPGRSRDTVLHRAPLRVRQRLASLTKISNETG